MAREDTHKSAQESRVYRTNEVHKRRVGRVSPARKDDAVSVEAVVAGPEAEQAAAGTSVPVAAEGIPERDARMGDDDTRATESQRPARLAAETHHDVGWEAEAGDPIDQPAGDEADEPLNGDEEGLERRSDRKSVRSSEAKRGRAKRWALVAVAVLVVLAVAWASIFAWNRWGRYDDAADIQGQWYVDGTAAPIVIDGDTMQLDDNVAYHYELDTREKTIRFSFGSWEGQGRYRFSDDRQRLLIIDGQYSGVGNLFQDLFVSFDEMARTGAPIVVEAPQEETEASEASASGEGEAVSGAAQDANGQESAASGTDQQASGQAGTASGTAQQGGAQAPAAEDPSQQAETATKLGQGVSLFNRQPDPEALKAKEEAEKAAQEKAEREAAAAAKAEAEAEAAEYVDYGYYYYYDDSSEYDEGDGGEDDGEYYSDEDEET